MKDTNTTKTKRNRTNASAAAARDVIRSLEDSGYSREMIAAFCLVTNSTISPHRSPSYTLFNQMKSMLWADSKGLIRRNCSLETLRKRGMKGYPVLLQEKHDRMAVDATHNRSTDPGTPMFPLINPEPEPPAPAPAPAPAASEPIMPTAEMIAEKIASKLADKISIG